MAAGKELFAYYQVVVLMERGIEGDLLSVENRKDFWDESGARNHAHLLFDVFVVKMTAGYDEVEQRNLYAQLQDFQVFPEAFTSPLVYVLF